MAPVALVWPGAGLRRDTVGLMGLVWAVLGLASVVFTYGLPGIRRPPAGPSIPWSPWPGGRSWGVSWLTAVGRAGARLVCSATGNSDRASSRGRPTWPSCLGRRGRFGRSAGAEITTHVRPFGFPRRTCKSERQPDITRTRNLVKDSENRRVCHNVKCPTRSDS